MMTMKTQKMKIQSPFNLRNQCVSTSACCLSSYWLFNNFRSKLQLKIITRRRKRRAKQINHKKLKKKKRTLISSSKSKTKGTLYEHYWHHAYRLGLENTRSELEQAEQDGLVENLLSLQAIHLDADAEMRKLFGPGVVCVSIYVILIATVILMIEF